jgi:hypothetical protein
VDDAIGQERVFSSIQAAVRYGVVLLSNITLPLFADAG